MKNVLNSIKGTWVPKMEYRYTDVLTAKTDSEINEASLGRVYQHVMNSGDQSFAILTSWRQALSQADNLKNYAVLKKEIRSMGLGFFEMDGKGQETDAEGNITVAVEPSLFVPKMTIPQAIKICKKYQQDFFLYSGPETQGNVQAFDGTGKFQVDTGSFHPNRIAKFYSTVKGKDFTFESLPNNIGEMRLRESYTDAL
jgi:hypothetical protein